MQADPSLASAWSPPQRIRPIAIGLIVEDGHALLMEVRDRSGTLKGFRPVGGGIEFGEAAGHALTREFQEELGWKPLDLQFITVCENLFEHNGSPGHEIVFVFKGRRPNDAPPPDHRTRIDFEDHGTPTSIRWVRAGDLAGTPLFPDQIAPLLKARIDRD
ncbi:NUDIX domain-containing protein [Fulvimarina sp. MAC8]|uniref:NUDIX hydrolase n=1 Tax=Fulvimarina sp. MAC8 TaxID=3162874 RepID=UPI0032EEDA3E